jgi:hypothetical protein
MAATPAGILHHHSSSWTCLPLCHL